MNFIPVVIDFEDNEYDLEVEFKDIRINEDEAKTIIVNIYENDINVSHLLLNEEFNTEVEIALEYELNA